MRRYAILALFCAIASAHAWSEGVNGGGSSTEVSLHLYGYGIPIAEIDPMFRIRAPGSNILVCEHGDVVAVFYGASSFNPSMMEPRVAYSLNSGSTWTFYGPFGLTYRMQGAMDGPANFCQIGGLIFIWNECTQYFSSMCANVVLEENVPSAPSFSVPITLPNSQYPAMYPWNPDISMAPDDITSLVATAWSFIGNEWAYCWISNDGGYSWTDTIPMAHITQDGTSGCLSRGVGDYVLYAYLDYYTFSGTDSTIYPFYMESTDDGYTWSQETPVPEVPVNTGSQFWWGEFDCLVINNEPWLVYTDLGTPGGGPYIMRGTGGPGNWTWDIWDAGQLGTCSLTVADTIFYCYPSQYPNLSYDPVSNTVLASYKVYYFKEYADTTYYDGAHIGGIYTTNNGNHWIITQPLSDTNTTQIQWYDWGATEVAYRLANIAGEVWAYGIWVHGVEQVLHFERGKIESFSPLAVNEEAQQNALFAHVHVTPSISTGSAGIEFTLSHQGRVEINLYDISGRLVSNVHKGTMSAGYHLIQLNNTDLPNGIYFLSFQIAASGITRKFVLMR
ncbi:MAG: T9SS type A sorting domain-containing protein [candidate division WOR-3 bacterium]|nr:MAG: T9SS type A sorting domain-containing protein [candidate division WOR-3 bacterium]